MLGDLIRTSIFLDSRLFEHIWQLFRTDGLQSHLLLFLCSFFAFRTWLLLVRILRVRILFVFLAISFTRCQLFTRCWLFFILTGTGVLVWKFACDAFGTLSLVVFVILRPVLFESCKVFFGFLSLFLNYFKRFIVDICLGANLSEVKLWDSVCAWKNRSHQGHHKAMEFNHCRKIL